MSHSNYMSHFRITCHTRITRRCVFSLVTQVTSIHTAVDSSSSPRGGSHPRPPSHRSPSRHLVSSSLCNCFINAMWNAHVYSYEMLLRLTLLVGSMFIHLKALRLTQLVLISELFTWIIHFTWIFTISCENLFHMNFHNSCEMLMFIHV